MAVCIAVIRNGIQDVIDMVMIDFPIVIYTWIVSCLLLVSGDTYLRYE